jgi:hypothetical protein
VTAASARPPVVRFRDGAVVAYQVPHNTLDPRYRLCAEHRVACDCREAERQESIADLKAELVAVKKAALELLAGHDVHGDDGSGCMCTGCQIVRRSHIYLSWTPFVGPMERPDVAPGGAS